MNTKLAKRLRKSLGYHPTDPRKYSGFKGTPSGGIELKNCSRLEYQRAKAQLR